MSDIILNAQQLSTLSRVLESFCTAFSADEHQRDSLARLILQLYADGAHTDEELASALDREIARSGGMKALTA